MNYELIKIWLLAALMSLAINATPQTTKYKMAGPYEIIARDGTYRSSKAGSERDMKQALDFATAGKAEEATAIINAYAKVLKGVDGHDAPLCTIQGYDLVRAMILMREHRTPEWDDMIRRAFLPVIDRFEAESPYANGNWGAIVNRMRMACGIYLEDERIYKAAKEYFLGAEDNGSLPHYISETGQCQETGRDQAHVQLGLEALCQTAEMAWQRGDDLWGAYDNRLFKGIEYTARYNLGYDVPFQTWEDCTGLYCEWTQPGQMSRGKLWDIYALPYSHYHERKGLSMPYAEKAIRTLANPRMKARNEKISERYTKLHSVSTFPAPAGSPLMHNYDVYVRPRSSNEWTRIDTYMAKANAPIGNNKHKVCDYSYAYFNFTGDVFVKVVCRNRKFSNVKIRPDYRGVIANIQNDSTVQFLLFQPENVSVEFDGDITDNLLLFTSKIDERASRNKAVALDPANPVMKSGGNYCLPAGYHILKDTLFIPSNSRLTLHDGAYIDGVIVMRDVENVELTGHGVIRPSRGRDGVRVERSRNVKCSGFITTQCPIGESDGIEVRDIKSLTHYSWGDGLNVFASKNVSYDRVFCRNSDDCTTAYCTRKGFNGNCENIKMTNSTLWADVAHPIFIGIHGNSERMDTCQNLEYRNIDILCQSEPQIDYQGCLAINCGDNNLVRNVTFSNIRIESLHQGSIVSVRTSYNDKYCTAPGRGVENVMFRNIRYNGTTPEYSIIEGYNEQRKVYGITFDNLRINGKHIHDDMPEKPKWYHTSDIMRCFVGNHVEGVVFR